MLLQKHPEWCGIQKTEMGKSCHLSRPMRVVYKCFTTSYRRFYLFTIFSLRVDQWVALGCGNDPKSTCRKCTLDVVFHSRNRATVNSFTPAIFETRYISFQVTNQILLECCQLIGQKWFVAVGSKFLCQFEKHNTVLLARSLLQPSQQWGMLSPTRR